MVKHEAWPAEKTAEVKEIAVRAMLSHCVAACPRNAASSLVRCCLHSRWCHPLNAKQEPLAGDTVRVCCNTMLSSPSMSRAASVCATMLTSGQEPLRGQRCRHLREHCMRQSACPLCAARLSHNCTQSPVCESCLSGSSSCRHISNLRVAPSVDQRAARLQLPLHDVKAGWPRFSWHHGTDCKLFTGSQSGPARVPEGIWLYAQKRSGTQPFYTLCQEAA